ncbi:MAG: transcription antitermination factor NusB [Bacillota bacterium]
MRKDAREIVFKLVFEYLFTGKTESETKVDLLLSKEYEIKDEDNQYIERVFHGVVENIDVFKEAIKEKSIGFELERIYKTDLAILILALYEMKYESDVPVKVAVNEALNLSKKFGSEKSGSFINGVLASLADDFSKAE